MTPAERADRDVAQGITDLEAALQDADEYVVSGDATGKRLIIPQRAMLVGMLDHLRRSYRARHEEAA